MPNCTRLTSTMSEPIPLSVPTICGNEWKYVKECLDTGWVSSAGRFVEQFERDVAKYTGASHAVACVNGTSALHVALRLVGVEAGNEVIVPTVTFIAPVNAVRYLSAQPIFMDCDRYYNIDIEKTIEYLATQTVHKKGITTNKVTGRRIAAIVPVHVFGNPVNIEPLVAFCRDLNIAIVEDATESLGSFYTQGQFAGRHTGTIGELGCLSFNGNKIITTGGGGMIITNDAELAARARYLTTQAKDDEVRYVHNEIGYNYRLTNIQSAIGSAQLEQLPRFVETKRRNYLVYKEAINAIEGLILAEVPPYANANCWMYAVQVDKKLYGAGPEDVMKRLEKERIQTRPVWKLNHLQKPFELCETYKIERAFELHACSLNIPCSVNLTMRHLQIVIQALQHG